MEIHFHELPTRIFESGNKTRLGQLFFLLSRTIVKKKIKFSSKKNIAIIIINPMYSSKNQTILGTLLCQKIV